MIVLDANLLLYAYDSSAQNHAAAKAFLEHLFSGSEPVGLPLQTLATFLRIATNPSLRGTRFTNLEAVAIVDSWLEQPSVRLLIPSDAHWRLLRKMLLDGQARGPMVTDAQLAAIAIECGGVLYSTDGDFSRFPGLRWQNPLV
jgi:uncharacterized protein